MNIFVLHEDPIIAAQMQCDKHVVKMILESVQMISTVTGRGYKPTHAKHPCTLWAAENQHNFNWLVSHTLALCNEYTARYSKSHKSFLVLHEICDRNLRKYCDYDPNSLTPFALAMPDEYKCDDVVESYQKYYASKFIAWSTAKRPMRWTSPGTMPDWLKQYV